MFLRIGICLWSLATVLHWLLFLFRNFVFGKAFANAVAIRLSGVDQASQGLDPPNVLQVDISVPRPWHVKAGQAIYVSIPELGFVRGLRGHPFMISWWNRDQRGLTVSLLVKSRTGFTAELDRHANRSLRAFIDGPFGKTFDFGEYSTVIMFAPGIGIASHMPYMRDLISGYNSCEVKTRRILLIWQIEKECEYQVPTKAQKLMTSSPSTVGQAMDGRAFRSRHRIRKTTLSSILMLRC